MGDLLFQQDELGRYIGSPYDVFLRINHLPVQPKGGETIPQYNQRLFQIVSGLDNPTWVDGKLGSFQYHPFPFKFGLNRIRRPQDFSEGGERGRGWFAARRELRRLSSGAELF